MKSISTTRRKLPAPTRTETVFMGRNDYFSTVVRLIGVELYKIRRRAMSKVLATICILSAILVFGLISLGTVFVVNTPVSNYLPPSCSQVSDPKLQTCLDHTPTSQEVTQAVQNKQEALRSISDPLRLPTSLGVVSQLTRNLGLLLVIILAGTIVGGEYGVGTIRLMFTRGPTRTQFFLAKIGAIALSIILGFLTIFIIGVGTGALLNLISGISSATDFLTAAWISHLLLYMLVGMLGLFLYGMMALFLAVLGRATAAGVAGALAWGLLEPVVGDTLSLLGSFNKGPLGDFLRAVPDYFISTNISVLLQNEEHIILNTQVAQLSSLHALLVLLTYLVLFIGIAWWAIQRRDITN